MVASVVVNLRMLPSSNRVLLGFGLMIELSGVGRTLNCTKSY